MKLPRILALTAAVLSMTGCEKTVVQVVQVAQVADIPQASIHVVGRTRASGGIQLEREYQEEIKSGITLTVVSKQTGYTSIYPDGIEFDDVLTQADGKRVDFNCDAVADKIIDRELVPIVQKECKTTHAVAMDFWTRTPPTEFGDDRGRIWKLK